MIYVLEPENKPASVFTSNRDAHVYCFRPQRFVGGDVSGLPSLATRTRH
jgi:hypothetical protein